MTAPDLVRTVRDALAKAAIPSRGLKLMRYDHGGGRMFTEVGDERHLIADFYHEGERELLYSAPEWLAALAARVEALETELAQWDLPHDDTVWVRASIPLLKQIGDWSPPVRVKMTRQEGQQAELLFTSDLGLPDA